MVDWLPPVLVRYKDFVLLMEAEEPEFHILWGLRDTAQENVFVLTCDIVSLTRYEAMYGIEAQPGETEEFRRARLLAKLAVKAPLTWRWLLALLRELYGEGNFTAVLEAGAYTIRVRLMLGVKALLELVETMLRELVPQNMVIDVNVVYNTWDDVGAAFTWTQAGARTWKQLREDVI
jgi:hypothetical protein